MKIEKNPFAFSFSIKMLQIVKGNLLEANEEVIVQQLNCVTLKSHGLSKSIAEKYPYADVYSQRRPDKGKSNLAVPSDRGKPGTIIISRPPTSTSGPVIVGIYGQYQPGKPNRWHFTADVDTAKLRLQWFEEALHVLANWIKTEKIHSLAFPYQIGCGLAGGNWEQYESLLQKFAETVPAQVVLYRL